MRLARMIAPTGKRMYAAARASRLTSGWQTSNTSADSELVSSLTALRSRSRAVMRDSAYAKRARTVVQNNVIGTGIGMQAQVMNTRNELATRVNDGIEAAWLKWSRADSCHTGGSLCFADLERMVIGQVFEAGEIFIRLHSRAFGDSAVPFALEVIESERMAEEYSTPNVPTGAEIRMGVEVDSFGRPLAYWMHERHPGELRFARIENDKLVRVPAAQIIHLKVTERWPQTRGEPWLHAVVKKLNDMDGYTEAEIVAARGAASYMGIIETEDLQNSFGDPKADGTQELSLEPGTVQRVGPGEKFVDYMPNRPNSALDPFMRYMLREFCAGVSMSYESVSRDYSQSNYSSSRLSLLDDRDIWRFLQQWFIRAFREPVHRAWLQMAVLSGAIPEVNAESYAINPDKFESVLFKPRGWGWVDPTKEVEAYKMAVRCGFTTISRVIAATGDGMDLEDFIVERKRELELLATAGIVLDTDVTEPTPVGATKPAPPTAETTPTPAPATDTTPAARVVQMRTGS
jgi:lambda family phage portal protein